MCVGSATHRCMAGIEAPLGRGSPQPGVARSPVRTPHATTSAAPGSRHAMSSALWPLRARPGVERPRGRAPFATGRETPGHRPLRTAPRVSRGCVGYARRRALHPRRSSGRPGGAVVFWRAFRRFRLPLRRLRVMWTAPPPAILHSPKGRIRSPYRRASRSWIKTSRSTSGYSPCAQWAIRSRTGERPISQTLQHDPLRFRLLTVVDSRG
jgi:hypothetical protein